jgi:hypothetical protein
MRRRAALAALAMALLAPALSAKALAAPLGPLYDVHAHWADANLPPGGEGQFIVQARNLGDAVGGEDLVIEDKLPAGLTVNEIRFRTFEPHEIAPTHCSTPQPGTARCVLEAAELATYAPPAGDHVNGTVWTEPGFLPTMYVVADVPANAEGTGTNSATLYGGGGTLPDGTPCAQNESQLLTLPPCAEAVNEVPFDPTPASFGIAPGTFAADVFDADYPAGAPLRHAGAHPAELRVDFDFNQELATVEGHPTNLPVGKIKTVEATLPRGLIGNPEATPKCDAVDFAEVGATTNSTGCPSDTQVGVLNVDIVEAGFFEGARLSRVAIYNLQPPKGVPADFGFNAQGLVQGHIYPNIDPAQDYAIESLVPNIGNLTPITSSEATFWGVPGDPAHDKFRFYPKETGGHTLGAPWGSAPIRPLLTDPTDCGEENGGARIRVESYNNPGQFTQAQEYSDHLDVTGCDDPRFRFEPDISLQPTSRDAGGPTGLDVHLEVPQQNDEVSDATQLYTQSENLKAIATPPIKRSVVTLPEGMTLNPSAAQGLATCSTAQIGLISTDPIRFNASPVTCPDASQFGRLTIHTPILPVENQPEGFIYVASQGDNPFHNFLSLYLVIEEPERGILVKIAGRVDLDPKTGQITTTFDRLPQFPVSDLQLSLKGGVRAGLVNPATCGKKTITAEFFSWQDPSTPHSVKSSYDVTQKPNGSPCVNDLGERPFQPTLDAGTTKNTAGSYSPFAMRLTRTDDDQELSQLGLTLPPGLAAKFAGVTICPASAIAQAEARTAAGDGALEQADPSCPASSSIGITEVGAGVGVPLTYVPGKVYLAGSYKGAPISIVAITPSVVGPFDLGVIAVRTALDVNSVTAQGSARTDPLPQIVQGIPVRIRDIRLHLDRPDFILNPTSCAEKRIDAHVTGTGGDITSTVDDTAAELSQRFWAADCASLGFKPKLSLRLFGGTHRGAHPRLRAVVTYPKGGGYANIAAASVALPRSEFLENAHIKTVCTRVQFAAKACPADSIYGRVEAKTPLFDQPLQGPIYLRSSSHQLPDLVAVLRGPDSQPIEVDLDGRIDSVDGGIRNTFEVVPDAPVDWAVFAFQGGKKGLLVNSTNLCAKAHRATAKFSAQNGRRIVLHPKVTSTCKKAHRKKRKR